MSISRSVSWTILVRFFGDTGGFCVIAPAQMLGLVFVITDPAHPHKTSVAVYPALFNWQLQILTGDRIYSEVPWHRSLQDSFCTLIFPILCNVCILIKFHQSLTFVLKCFAVEKAMVVDERTMRIQACN